MKIWITKYALSEGIIEKEGEECPGFPRMIQIRIPGKASSEFFHKPDWHTSKEEAISRAEEMRQKKIASLQKQIKKLERMTF